MTISSIPQIFGALLILAPFALAQFRLLGQHSWPYLLPNMAGSALLCALALLGAQWGFVLLENVWALVSLWGHIALLRGKRTPPRILSPGRRTGDCWPCPDHLLFRAAYVARVQRVVLLYR
ncbi:MAG TPA: hypothetical protein VFW17_21590 [Ktedonobacterales bacterium]|nr:hypothetical protein [Ktedonobacterales bacterium]